MISSREINDLAPQVASLCREFKAACAAQGIDALITCTYRDSEAQNVLYAQGRTAPGPVVTDAKGGESFHQFKCAFDFVPVVNGKAQWNDLKTIERCGVIGESVGLEWAGRWVKFHERLHLQWTGGLSLKDLQSGKPLPELP